MPCFIRKVGDISKKNCSLVLWTIENGDAYETEYIKLLNTHQQTTIIYVIKPKL